MASRLLLRNSRARFTISGFRGAADSAAAGTSGSPAHAGDESSES